MTDGSAGSARFAARFRSEPGGRPRRRRSGPGREPGGGGRTLVRPPGEVSGRSAPLPVSQNR